MLNRLTTLWILGLFLTVPAYLSAQVLTAERHTPCFRDSLEVYKMPYTAVGDSGRNCVWDFSNLPMDSAEIVPLYYYVSSPIDTMHIGFHREHAHYYLLSRADTLWQLGYETSRTRMCYSSPLPLLRFPFTYGDTLASTMSGAGQYCHRIPLSVEGKTIVRADACGHLLLPDMSVDSVLRVHSTMQYVERLQGKSQIQEDRYQWYSATCRYPVLDIVQTRAVTDADTVSSRFTYYFPQEQENVRLHEEDPKADAAVSTDSLITNVSFMPNPVHTDLRIQYYLAHDAQVYVSLHYNGGISTYQTSKRKEEAGNHSVSVNMSGMPIGNYVVYIHADDTVASGNILKI
ncbi:MAG: hypothetical protein IKO63_07300 [Paludibacteraceae bacterium]|nr:hypothetical protein [Paludibacteraceae bacterium]